MNQEEFKAQMQMEIKKSEQELKVKKLLLKQALKKPRTPFMETKVGRGWNRFLAFMTTPCAATNQMARAKLENPKAYRAGEALKGAYKVLQRCERATKNQSEEDNKLAALAALHETILSQFQDVPEYEQEILETREQLSEYVQKLRTSNPTAVNSVADDLASVMEHLRNLKPDPQGT